MCVPVSFATDDVDDGADDADVKTVCVACWRPHYYLINVCAHVDHVVDK
jgi:hypothetical protein